MRGVVFDIKKFAIHDGPGIRTTVFLKGCPLTCHWCHNPESQNVKPETLFDAEGVGKTVGWYMTVDEVIADVLKDKLFYDSSNGGLTISGGEPLMQAEFCRQIFKKAKENGLHCCLDTSGYVDWVEFEKVLPFIDLVLYDLKETDPELHQKDTGGALQVVLDNLYQLDAAGVSSVLRCPLVPGYNLRNSHADGIAKIANKLQHLQAIELLPYHPLGMVKFAGPGLQCHDLPTEFLNRDDIKPFQLKVSQATNVNVQIL